MTRSARHSVAWLVVATLGAFLAVVSCSAAMKSYSSARGLAAAFSVDAARSEAVAAFASRYAKAHTRGDA